MKSTGCTRTHEKNQICVVAVTLLPHVHPQGSKLCTPQGAQQQANSKFSCPQDPASHSAKYCTPIMVFHEHILYHIYCVQHPLISIRLYICFSSCMMRRRSFHQLMLLLLLSQRKHLVLLVPRCLGQCELRTSDW